MLKRFIAVGMTFATLLFASSAVAQSLLVDFNSTTQDGDAHNQEGYQPYDAAHENIDSFGPRDYDAFGTSVTMTPLWPNTTDSRVQQAIDRGAGNDANWLGDNLDLLTDWIGADSRTGNGGNGDWDRTEATQPTYMTLTFEGLPEGNYRWLSYHHDTEHMWSDFQVEISTDGGANFDFLADNQITDSTPGGSPDSTTGTGLGIFQGDTDPDPKNLPSTFVTSFTATGSDDVVLRFAPFIDGLDGNAVHKNFFAMNGFELDEFGEFGDFNSDGSVDLADYDILRANFRSTGDVTFAMGDNNFDRSIDLQDFLDFQSAFAGAQGGAAVPEPSTLGLLAMGLLGWLGWASRRSK